MDSAHIHEALRRRIENEFWEMPGLTLTIRQAGRLWNMPALACEAALASLVDTGFLRRTNDGQFLRPTST